jgi:MoxR-like ATPase
MRPIPAPRLGDAHGLLRAIGERERLRLDEFVTEFTVEELFPPGLENALGRTRQFVSFARSAGLLNEDRGTVELTEMGKRYVRAGDTAKPFDVAPAQAEWLRRLLRERHMTDSIYHGAAVGLSLYASNPLDFRVSMLDFGRALNYLGRAGWDSDNTFQSQGERYTTFLADLELVDAERRLTPTGQQTRDELTLPIHMSLKDLAGQLNPGGPEAAAREGEAEWAAAAAAAEPVAEAPVAQEAAPAIVDEDEYEDVGPGAGPSPAAAPPEPVAAAPAAPPPAPAAAPPPAPPADVWDRATPDDRTQAYQAIGVEPPAVETPVPAEAAPAAPTADAPVEPARGAPTADAPVEPARGGITSGDPLAGPAAAPPRPEPPAAPPRPEPPAAPPPPEPPAPAPVAAPPPPAGPRPDELAAAAAATIASSAPPAAAPRAAAPPAALVSAGAIRAAAEEAGLRLPAGVYAAVAAALAGGHVVLVGPAGSGKTTLALAIAKAAAQSGKSTGATLVTAAHRWSARDTVGRPGDEEWERGVVVDAASRGRWLVVDELDRARLDRALGELSSFLSGAPVALPEGETAPPGDWRIVATAAAGGLAGSAALVRRFAHVHVPPPGEAELAAAIDSAAGGDATAAAAAKRLLGARDLGPVGTGAFLAAARFAAARNAAAPADELTLAREALAAHVAPLLGELDEEGRARLVALAGRP